MSTTELSPPGSENKLAKLGAEQAKKARATYTARASSDFYGGIGWAGWLVLLAFVSAPVILFFLNGGSFRSSREYVLYSGIGVWWWLQSFLVGVLGSIFWHIR